MRASWRSPRAAIVVTGVAVPVPDLVMHQLTDLPDDHAQFADHADANARMRREGTRNLLAAAQAADTPRFIAQLAIQFAPPIRRGG